MVERSDESMCLFLSASNTVETTPDQGNTSEVFFSYSACRPEACMAWPRQPIVAAVYIMFVTNFCVGLCARKKA